MKKILIIEDDPATVAGLSDTLTEEHFDVSTVMSGQMGYESAKDGGFDLIILDLMLPEKSGIDVCKDLRKDGVNTLILMLTGKKEEIDKVIGLEIGADDYVTKPFSIRELVARVKALLRRPQEIRPEVEEYSFGEVHLDFKKQEVKKGKIKNISPLQLLMNLLSMTIFPFIGKPVFQVNLGIDEMQFRMIMEQRKKEIPAFIIDAIKK